MAVASTEVEEAKVDLTSMIDVIFLLLIFFMVGTKFKTEEGRHKAFLPKNKGQAAGSPKDLSEVRINVAWVDLNGSNTDTEDPREAMPLLSIKGKAYPSTTDPRTGTDRPDWDYLSERLEEFRNAYQGENQEGLPVIIDASPYVPWQHVVSVLDACAKARVKDISFAAAGHEID